MPSVWPFSNVSRAVRVSPDEPSFSTAHTSRDFRPLSTMATATSSAAVATLTVSSSILEKDILLKIVSNLASPYQLTILTKKKGTDCQLEVTTSKTVLEERNALLRALAGPVLHYALSNVLLGGTADKVVLSSISSWMTTAHSIRTKSMSVESALKQLESQLDQSAFLVPSSCATLADYDVLLALLAGGSDDVTIPPSVARWIRTVHAQMTDLAATPTKSVLDSVPVLSTILSEEPPYPVPMFFYGTETDAPIPSSAPAASTKTTTTTKAEDSKTPQAAPKGGVGGGAGGGLSEEEKKAVAEKRAKKQAEKAAKKAKAAPQQSAAAADWDIYALDIRVGHIKKVWHHESAEKLFCEEIDVGEPEPRKIASGLRPYYQTSDMEDKRVLVLCNLKARNLVGFPSHGMVLCASDDAKEKVQLMVPPEDAKIGDRVLFDGLEEKAPETEAKVNKKKLLEKLLPDLKTNQEGVMIWKEFVSKPACHAVQNMANGNVS